MIGRIGQLGRIGRIGGGIVRVPAPEARIFAADYSRGEYWWQGRSVPLSGLPGYVYAGTAAGTAWTNDGLLEVFAPGAPRITDAGLTTERAATNLVWPSTPSTPPWTAPRVGVSAGSAGPFGASARVVTQTGSSSVNERTVAKAVTAPGLGTVIRVEAIVRSSGARWAVVGLHNNGGYYGVAVADLETASLVGTVAHPSYLGTLSGSVEALADGWRRCVFVGTRLEAASGINVCVGASTTLPGLVNPPILSGDGTNGVDVAYVGAFTPDVPTTPIVATGAPATRPADPLYYTSPEIADLLAGDWTIVTEAASVPIDAANIGVISVSIHTGAPAGAGVNRLSLNRGETGNFTLAAIVSNSGAGSVIYSNTSSITGPVRAALSRQGDVIRCSINGRPPVQLTTTAPLPAMNRLDNGYRAGAANSHLGGGLRRIGLIPRALAGAELPAASAL